METIIIIFIAIALLTKRRKGVLGCGITAFCPNGKQVANLDWMKFLFLSNISRGTDGCGIWINDRITKGINIDGNALNFMSNNPIQYDSKSKNKTIIAHTRNSTMGGKVEATTHPFTYTHEGRTIIACHNGVIRNHWELGRELGVDTASLTVDSQVLIKCLLEKGFDVLRKYKGHAALVWAYDNEPNTLYVFRGSSKETSVQKEPLGERPLHFITTSEGVYISSEYEPLDAICNQEVESFAFLPNQVIRIHNNKRECIQKIDREEANVYTFPQQGDSRTKTTTENAGNSRNLPLSEYPSKVRLTKPYRIYEECTNALYGNRFTADTVQFMAGRYYRIPTAERNSLYRTHDHVSTQTPDIEDFLMSGEFYISDCTNVDGGGCSYILSREPSTYQSSYYIKRLFYEGILIDRTKEHKWKDQKMAHRFDHMANMNERLKQLSSYSQYPITLLFSQAEKLVKKEQGIFVYGGNPIKEPSTYCPAFVNRCYCMAKGGRILAIMSKFPKDSILLSSTTLVVDPEGKVFVKTNNGLIEHSPKPREITWNSGSDLDQSIINISDELSLVRYSGLNRQKEHDYKVDEELNGLSNLQYYDIKDENVSISGAEAKTLAIKMIVSESFPNWESNYITLRADTMFDEGDSSNQGLIATVLGHYPECEFGLALEMAIVQLMEEAREELYKNHEENDDVQGESQTES